MLFHFADGLFVGVHSVQSPTLKEWQRHCAVVKRLRCQMRAVLVYSEGGGPGSTQREELRGALQGGPLPRTAVVTAAPFVRGIVTSLNWFFKDQKIVTFAPPKLDAALLYLGAGGLDLNHEEVVRTLSSLAQQLGVSLPAAAASPVSAVSRVERSGT